VDSDGNPAAGGNSINPDISSDGQFVAFQSAANNLVANDFNGVQDIFIHDRDTDGNSAFDEPGAIATVRVSVDSNGNPAAGGNSTNPDISSDGQFVAFQSAANNLVANDTNGVQDIFVHDRDTDGNSALDEPGAIATARVSVDSNGNPAAGGNSTNPDISANGQFVVFQSAATNLLVPGNDTNGQQDIFLHNRNTSTTIRVNVDSSGNPAAGGDSTDPAISKDNRHVAFQSLANNLVDNDTNGLTDIFVHDRDVHADGTFDESGDIATVRTSVRTMTLSSSDGTLTTASSSGGGGSGGSCFITTAGFESSALIAWALLFSILGTVILLPRKLSSKSADRKR
jgi:Tol biopolymer transport system component